MNEKHSFALTAVEDFAWVLVDCQSPSVAIVERDDSPSRVVKHGYASSPVKPARLPTEWQTTSNMFRSNGASQYQPFAELHISFIC
jgi:hypothetical protein